MPGAPKPPVNNLTEEHWKGFGAVWQRLGAQFWASLKPANISTGQSTSLATIGTAGDMEGWGWGWLRKNWRERERERLRDSDCSTLILDIYHCQDPGLTATRP